MWDFALYSSSGTKHSCSIILIDAIRAFIYYSCMRKLCLFYSYAEAPKVNTERVKACQNCSINVLGDPELQESAATPSGNYMIITNSKT